VLAHTFQLFIQLIVIQETWNEHYATNGCSKATPSYFLQAITTWYMHKLMQAQVIWLPFTWGK